MTYDWCPFFSSAGPNTHAGARTTQFSCSALQSRQASRSYSVLLTW